MNAVGGRERRSVFLSKVAVVAPHGVAVTVVAFRGAAVAITVVVVVAVGGGAMVRPRVFNW